MASVADRSAGSEPIRIGWIGAGFVGQVAHLPSFSAVPNARIVALAEARPELARQVAARYDIPTVYAHHSEMLEDPAIDAVVVITARPSLGPIALDALRAGKHVFTEKPMAADVTQARQLIASAEEAKRIYAVGTMRRFDAGVEHAARLIRDWRASGEVGALTFVRSHCFQGNDYCAIGGAVGLDSPRVPAREADQWPTAPEWVPESQHDAYARFNNVFCHSVNLHRYLVDDPFEIGYARLAPTAGGLVVFESDGYSATLEAGELEHDDWDETIEVYFERARLRITPPPAFLPQRPAVVSVYRDDVEQTWPLPPNGWSWSFQRQAQAFVDAILSGEEPVNSGAATIGDLEAIEACWRYSLARDEVTA